MGLLAGVVTRGVVLVTVDGKRRMQTAWKRPKNGRGMASRDGEEASSNMSSRSYKERISKLLLFGLGVSLGYIQASQNKPLPRS